MKITKRKELEQLIGVEIVKVEKIIANYRLMLVPQAPDNAIGRVSRMDAINNRSVAEAGLRQAEEKLNKLQFALGKVDSEEFGICRRCENEIPPLRLMLMPQSLFCVNCAK